jgi:hypothetical protein
VLLFSYQLHQANILVVMPRVAERRCVRALQVVHILLAQAQSVRHARVLLDGSVETFVCGAEVGLWIPTSDVAVIQSGVKQAVEFGESIIVEADGGLSVWALDGFSSSVPALVWDGRGRLSGLLEGEDFAPALEQLWRLSGGARGWLAG